MIKNMGMVKCIIQMGIYKGDWQYDKRHGNGSFTYKNGSYYTGQWKNGKYNASIPTEVTEQKSNKLQNHTAESDKLILAIIIAVFFISIFFLIKTVLLCETASFLQRAILALITSSGSSATMDFAGMEASLNLLAIPVIWCISMLFSSSE